MALDLSIRISGQAGQGIQTVGSILANVCHRAGLHVMAINDFESRIRGGSTFIQVRISNRPVQAPHDKINLLVALDDATFALYQNEVLPGGCAVTNSKTPLPDGAAAVPFEKLAAEAGGRITANTVAAGVALALLGAPDTLLDTELSARFQGKSDEIMASNIKAAQLGYQAAENIVFNWKFAWIPQPVKGRLMEGAQAVALGALAADCRFAAFYPMSPATAIMGHLAAYSHDFPLVVEQAEDEIAAVNMVIGAAFAGTRALTATSGGGFCLMVEGLGLAAMTETPIVVVNAQRPGPATGLPTRTAQADLLFAIHASQDEFPRFVFAPRTVDEAYQVTRRAFHLAAKYQVPAIILVDQHLNESWFVIRTSLEVSASVEKFTIADGDIPDPSRYQRFAITESGISPRALPCRGETLVMACSDEHTPQGHMTETVADRVAMNDKRFAKLPAMAAEMDPPTVYHGNSATLLVGWGSTQGALYEAVDILRSKGLDVGAVTFADLWPFPVLALGEILGAADAFLMVEQNTGAQLGQLIRSQTGLEAGGSILKYDGRPFYASEICDGVQRHLGT